jgi:hypothetical protein
MLIVKWIVVFVFALLQALLYAVSGVALEDDPGASILTFLIGMFFTAIMLLTAICWVV